MNHARLWTATSIIAVSIVISFIISVPRASELPLQAVIVTEKVVPKNVSIADTFKKGVHTITGSLEVDDACTRPTVEATVENASSTDSTILLSIALPQDDSVCLRLPTTVTFTSTLSAPSGLPIRVIVDGVDVTTNAT